MNKIYGFLAAILFFILMVPGHSLAMDYQHTMEIKDMNFSWSIDGDKIHVKISGKTTGWVAVGFNPEEAMLNANIIIGYVKKGKVKIEDHFGDRKRGHSSDKKLGGTVDITDIDGTEKGGVTTLSFTIPLDSKDQYDTPIKADGSDVLIFAYGGKRDSSKSRHKFRATYQIDLNSGEGKKVR